MGVPLDKLRGEWYHIYKILFARDESESRQGPMGP